MYNGLKNITKQTYYAQYLITENATSGKRGRS